MIHILPAMAKCGLLVLASAWAVTLPDAAQACRSAEFASYVVLQDPPSRLPPGAKLLRVRLLGDPRYWYSERTEGARAQLVGGRRAGGIVRLIPDSWTSCDGWSEVDGPGYVVAFPQGPRTYGVIGYHSKRYRTAEQDRSEGITGWYGKRR